MNQAEPEPQTPWPQELWPSLQELGIQSPGMVYRYAQLQGSVDRLAEATGHSTEEWHQWINHLEEILPASEKSLTRMKGTGLWTPDQENDTRANDGTRQDE